MPEKSDSRKKQMLGLAAGGTAAAGGAAYGLHKMRKQRIAERAAARRTNRRIIAASAGIAALGPLAHAVMSGAGARSAKRQTVLHRARAKAARGKIRASRVDNQLDAARDMKEFKKNIKKYEEGLSKSGGQNSAVGERGVGAAEAAAGGALATGAAGAAALGVHKYRKHLKKVRRRAKAKKIAPAVAAPLLAAGGLLFARHRGMKNPAAVRAREHLRRGGVGAFRKSPPSGIGPAMREMNEENLRRRGLGKKASGLKVGNASVDSFSEELVEIMEKVGTLAHLVAGAKKAKGVFESYGQQGGQDLLSQIGDKITQSMHTRAIRKANKAKLDRIAREGREFVRKHDPLPASHPAKKKLRAAAGRSGVLSRLKPKQQSKYSPKLRRLSGRDIQRMTAKPQPGVGLSARKALESVIDS